MTRCLLIDPDALSRASLARYLECFAFTVKVGGTAQELQRLALAEPFDVILLDLGVPGMDGLALCRWVREQLGVPLIAMMAVDDLERRVAALECGADDHIDKPHEPREVVARVRALMRRLARRTARRAVPGSPRGVAFAGWQLDLATRQLTSAQGEVVLLSATEFRLLSTFIGQPGHVIERARLADGLPGDGRAVDLAVSRLRHKLGDVPPRAQLIRTVRGEGYLLDADVVRH